MAKHCYIVAEISANHNGSLELALELVRLARAAGADAVKIQTYTADTLTLDCDNPYFRIGGGTLWDGTTLYKLYQQAHTPWEWHEAIFAEARNAELDCFSTPFDETAVDFLEQFDPPYHKIASFELNHHPLLAKVAATGRPVIMSTGMATLSEIEGSVEVLRNGGCTDLTLLKCTSSYPAPASEANLARMADMATRFGTKVGLSDHTMGIAVPVAAAAMGACVIEKHFCRSRLEPGPDSAFSLEPEEFAEMVRAVRAAEEAVGTVTYDRTLAEEKNLMFRRSIFVSRDMVAGEIISEHNLRVVRPGHGLQPMHYPNLMGRKVARSVVKGTPFTMDLLAASDSTEHTSSLILPEPAPFEKRPGKTIGWSDHYGALHVAAKYAGIAPLEGTFKGIWPHGCFGPWQNYSARLLVYNAPTADQVPLYMTRLDQVELLQREGSKNVKAIGLPIIYTGSSGAQRVPGSLLVIPTHTLIGGDPKDRTVYQRYAAEIGRIAVGFREVVVCVHPNCRKNGLWYNEFRPLGFQIVEGASTDDANALLRMRTLFERFETVTTNGWGSHVAYALAFGAKVSIYGSKPAATEASMLQDWTWVSDRKAMEIALSDEHAEAERAYLRPLFHEPKDAVLDIEWGRYLVGYEHQLNPAQMRKLLRKAYRFERARLFLSKVKHRLRMSLGRG